MQIDPESFERYFAGKATPEEKATINTWLSAGVPETIENWPKAFDKGYSRQQLWESIQSQRQRKTQALQKKKRRRLTLAAASIVLFLICSIFILIISQQETKPALTFKTIHAAAGQRKSIRLSDGSTIELNAGTTLRYPTQFNDTVRQVLLTGEAFFSIAKNTEKPFIVSSKRTSIRVLGTSFHVRDFTDEAYAAVSVVSGRIACSDQLARHTVLLGANEQALLSEGDVYKTAIQTHDLPAWQSGVLQFSRVTLLEAIPQIERWYGVNIRLQNNQYGSLEIKGNFKNKSIHQLMDKLAYLLNIHYTIQNKNVIIY